MDRNMVSDGGLVWRFEIVSRMFCSGLAKSWLGGVLNLQFIHCIAHYITLYAWFSCLKGPSNVCFVIVGMRADFTQLELKKSQLKPLDED